MIKCYYIHNLIMGYMPDLTFTLANKLDTFFATDSKAFLKQKITGELSVSYKGFWWQQVRTILGTKSSYDLNNIFNTALLGDKAARFRSDIKTYYRTVSSDQSQWSIKLLNAQNYQHRTLFQAFLLTFNKKGLDLTNKQLNCVNQVISQPGFVSFKNK